MSVVKFPPIKTVHGLIDDHSSLPRHGAVGDAWHEEHAGLLWVWDQDLEKWRDLNLWHGKGFAASVANLIGLGGGAHGAKGEKGIAADRGTAGVAGLQGSVDCPVWPVSVV